ncbi:MAG: hypothetical protein GXO77_00720 [Calditrichaeota bacterium]|nr:hypothetical protein [Calditrichota bacterium]
MINASAPGKMILLGEYAVLEDAPALVCAVNAQARVTFTPVKGGEFRLFSPALDLPELPFVVTPKGNVRFDPALDPDFLKRLYFFSKIFEFIFQSIDTRSAANRAWRIEINTDAFYSRELKTKLGFGSSAALCVALVSALARAFDQPWSKEELFRMALNAHHHAQGKLGSGIDIAASFFGGYLVYQRIRDNDPLTKVPRQIDACPGLFFKTVFTGTSASTRKMVRGVNQLKEAHPQIFHDIMDRLKKISEEGCLAFQAQQVPVFLKLISDFYQTLKELGERSGMPIISELHQKIADIAREQGTAYKPSGAGSGDIGILFSDDPQKLKAAAAHIQKEGFYPLDLKVSPAGYQVQLM